MTTSQGTKAMAETKTTQDELRGNPSLSTIGLLIVVIVIGYEWFVSGLTKIVNGDFTSGLADEMADKLGDTAGWYTNFLNGTVIPNASTLGYLIEFGEVLIGLTFILGALLWIFAWKRLSLKAQTSVVLLTAAAAVGGDAANGVLIMAAFGLGTVPLLAAFGAGMHHMRGPARDYWRTAAAVGLIVMGIYVALRPVMTGDPHAGHALQGNTMDYRLGVGSRPPRLSSIFV